MHSFLLCSVYVDMSVDMYKLSLDTPSDILPVQRNCYNTYCDVIVKNKFRASQSVYNS